MGTDPGKFTVFMICMLLITAVLAAAVVLWIVRTRRAEKGTPDAESRRAKNISGWIAGAVILLSAAAWVMNMGWIRFAAMFFPPLTALLIAHAVFLFIVMRQSAPLAREIPSVRWQRIAACAAYFIFYACLPDGGDYGPPYMFFMLIRHETAVFVGEYLAIGAMIASIILLCLLSARVKKAAAKTAPPPAAPADPAGEDPAGKNG